MDKTRRKLAAFFDQDDDEGPAPVPQKAIGNDKLNQFAQGTIRKSRREKEKDAAEAKRREEEESAARAYAEFVDAFEGDGTKKKADGGFVRAGGDPRKAYDTFPKGPETSSRASKLFEPEVEEPLNAPLKRGKRAMDAFLDEIKRDQADREARFTRHGHSYGKSATAMAAYEGQSGSKDRGDPETSNLFVANLPQHVTEASFGQFFARYGPVGSVKIMWPRTDGTVGPGADMTATRRNKNVGMSGFVSFMKRKDAEDALRELDGFTWGDSVLRVGWGKAVQTPGKPLYVARRSRSRSRSPVHSLRRRGSRTRSRSRSKDRDHYRSSRRERHQSRSRSHSPGRRLRRSRSRSPKRFSKHHDRSRSPRRRRSSSRHRDYHFSEEVSDNFIRAVAAQVKGNNAEYEDSLRQRERTNPQYIFLTDERHRQHQYYRSLVEKHDSLEPGFDDDGYNSVYSTDSAEESEKEHGKRHQLGRLASKRFQAMVRAMSGKRGEMARCMAFSLEHAEAASEVADIIVASLLVDGTAVPRKLSRLHLICDILHNSAVSIPGAWKFRQEFQSRLGLVFDHLSSIYHSFPGRITAETFKKQITSVVDIWEDWIVFPPEFTIELRERLEGNTAPVMLPQVEEVPINTYIEPRAFNRFKPSTFKPAEEVVNEISSEPAMEAATESDGEPMDEGTDEEVDGAPIEASTRLVGDDIDGEPVDDIDGEPVDDIDGAPIDGLPVDDIDGIPIDDIDGIPAGALGRASAPYSDDRRRGNVPMSDEDLDGEPIDEDMDGIPVHV